MKFQTASWTEKGPRKNNQDAFAMEPRPSPGIELMTILADGLGGHEAGEEASQAAVASVIGSLFPIMEGRDFVTPRDAQKITQEAHDDVWSIGLASPVKEGLATTLDVTFFADDLMTVLHIGDGRVYLIRGGNAKQLTHDQTVYQQQLDLKCFNPHPSLRNTLLQCIGGPVVPIPELIHQRIQPGDVILMCTDGVWRKYDNWTEVRACPKSLDVVIQRIVQDAIRAGSLDNATCVGILVS